MMPATKTRWAIFSVLILRSAVPSIGLFYYVMRDRVRILMDLSNNTHFHAD
jgi:hypothetical protein